MGAKFQDNAAAGAALDAGEHGLADCDPDGDALSVRLFPLSAERDRDDLAIVGDDHVAVVDLAGDLVPVIFHGVPHSAIGPACS